MEAGKIADKRMHCGWAKVSTWAKGGVAPEFGLVLSDAVWIPWHFQLQSGPEKI